MLIVQPDKDPMFRVNDARELLVVAKVLAIDEVWEDTVVEMGLAAS